MEKSMLVDEIFFLRKADKEERDQLLAWNENSQAKTKMIDELKRKLSDCDALTEKFRKEIAALKEQKKLSAKNRFGSKNQILLSRSRGSDPHEADKDDFDGSLIPGLLSEEAGTDISSFTGRKQE